ncbi:hypothetical protein JRF84_33590 [Methylobacterium organophilum]|jgi:hypothetical protein|uniref:hypothetical protein n=1 Tax=Methylobacterium organophilum TaxID=410 RepID=UPI0019D2F8A1|nr:hypothetical protein [Methylobacterium organophilum]MBN6824498.1 hypothetical protein [Methylobacterium organophilum]
MKIDVTKCTDAQLETLMANAVKSKDPTAAEVWRSAAIEVHRRGGSDYTDPVVAACHGALALLDKARFETTGQRRKSNYSLRSIQNNGEIAFMTYCALGKSQGTGFKLLVERGLGHYTVEHIVATNPDRFPVEAVTSARARLAEHGIAP